MSNVSQFASADLTAGQLNAIVKKLGGHDEALRFLRGETIVAEPQRKWREENGIIYFSVTSDGTTGEEWIKRLPQRGFVVRHHTRSALCSKDFKPTSGVTTEIAILVGSRFKEDDLINRNIRAFAAERKLEAPNAEVACLIRDKFSDEEIEAMGLWSIVVMHESIKDFEDVQVLLSVDRGDGGCSLSACFGKPGDTRSREDGFAFAAPVQVSSQI